MKRWIIVCLILLTATAWAGPNPQEIKAFLSLMEKDHAKWSQSVKTADDLFAPHAKEFRAHAEDAALVATRAPFFSKAKYDKKWMTTGRLDTLKKNLIPYDKQVGALKPKFKSLQYARDYLKQEQDLIRLVKRFLENDKARDAHNLLMGYEVPALLGYYPKEKMNHKTGRVTNTYSQSNTEAMKHFRKANNAYYKKKYKDAVYFVTQSIAAEPENPGWYLTRAKYYRKMKAYDKAESDIEAAEGQLESDYVKHYKTMGIQKGSPLAVHRAWGELHLARKNYDSAVSAFKSALALAKGSTVAQIHLELAECYKQQKDTKAYLAGLDQAIAANPDPKEGNLALRYKARYYRDQDMGNQAEATYKEAVSMAGNKYQLRFDTFLEFGRYYLGKGKYQSALDQFDLAWNEKKMQKRYGYKVFNARGKAYTLAGDMVNAQKSYAQYLSAKPKSYVAHRELAILDILKNNTAGYQSAKGRLNEGYKLSKRKDKFTAFYLYVAAGKLGEDARKVIVDHKKFTKNSAKKQLGVFKVILGEITPEAYMDRAKTPQGKAWQHYYLGMVALVQNNTNKARSHFTNAMGTGLVGLQPVAWSRQIVSTLEGKPAKAILLD